MARGDNGTRPGDVLPSSVSIVTPSPRDEMEAFDSLPEAVRFALAEGPYMVASGSALTAWLSGVRPAALVQHIERSSIELAASIGSIPGADYSSRPLSLKPARQRRPRR